MLELILGEVAQVVTRGQKVLPRKAEKLGYRFLHPTLAGALAALYADGRRSADKPKPVAAGVV
jgi:NAD dependent epimerase/dehydratase family enzyme